MASRTESTGLGDGIEFDVRCRGCTAPNHRISTLYSTIPPHYEQIRSIDHQQARVWGGARSGAIVGRHPFHRSLDQDDIATLYQRAIVIDALANPGSMNVSWPPRGPLSQKQRDAIASSGITAINVTVSADFEGSLRNIALWQGEADRYPDAAVDRPPPLRHRQGEAATRRSA